MRLESKSFAYWKFILHITLAMWHPCIFFSIQYCTLSEKLKAVCKKIGEIYEMRFIEIGMEGDHVHMLVQGVPNIRNKKHKCTMDL